MNTKKNIVSISGVNPDLAVTADLTPARSETGIGALMPWAGKLWFVSYVAHLKSTGSGTGLFEVDEDFNLQKHPESIVGTYANRMIHSPSDQLIIGPHFIDVNGKVRTIKEFEKHRLAATMEHLHCPKNKVYFLTMEGIMFEADVNSLKIKKLFNLLQELKIPDLAKPHFKAGYTGQDRVLVVNNTYGESDYSGETSYGRLAQWDGEKWEIVDSNAYNEVTGRKNFGKAILATGQDRCSAILKALINGKWLTYRLPKGSYAFDHTSLTEWPRIREIETERSLMDASGIFYEVPSIAYDGNLWGIKPISTHLRVIPDFCSWRGFLVLGGNQVSPILEKNIFVGQPQSNLWFGKTDDLWGFGPLKGWGGLWWDSDIKRDQPSVPFLMSGFDKKTLHLYHDSNEIVDFKLEVDFLGNHTWKEFDILSVGSNKYRHFEFPYGFSAHWIRLVPEKDCKATAYFTYN